MSELASESASTARPRMRTPSASEVGPMSELASESASHSASANADSERQRGGPMSELSMENAGRGTPPSRPARFRKRAGRELSELPFEVDEADAAEQVRDAGYDDEDYR